VPAGQAGAEPADRPAAAAPSTEQAEPAGGAGPSDRRSALRRILRPLVAVLFLAAIVAIAAQRWGEVRPLLGKLSVVSVTVAAVAVFAGIFATFLCWRTLLTDLGFTPPLTGGMRIFFVGQLGKYLPGSIWPAVAQMELGRDYRVPARASGTAVIIFMLTILGTGLVVAAPTLPLLHADAVGDYWWTWAVLPVALVVLTPAVANRLLALLLRVLRRPPLPAPLTLPGMLRAAGWSVAAWIGYGVHTWILVRQLGTPGGGRLFLTLTGAFAAAWCVGFLMIIAPAGAGVREAAFILLLTGAVPAAAATALAVVSRLLFTAGDIVWGAVAFALARRGTAGQRRQAVSLARSPRR
jgi:hypothetical protein